MKKSTRQAKQAAKARLSGAIATKSPKNKKTVFGDDDVGGDFFEDETRMQNGDSEDEENADNSADEDENEKSDIEDDEDEDAVEEVKGGTARESTQRLREAERKIAKESVTTKKKRKKKNDVVQKVEAENNESSESEDENEEGGDLLTDDFFKMVDTERADQVQKTKQDKKHKKLQQKKRLGKHTTFVVEDEYNMIDAPHKMGQNIEVVPIGGGESAESTGIIDEEQLLLISATLGSAPSKAATAFARGRMSCGTSKERGSESRKRKSKNDETWKRSRKLNRLGIGSRPGQAPALFVCKK
mmetsp:Transcript_21975/g.47736  ORF Transcript_21975/g.47736 Transcript_21975/m.47736 type:complete len:300 (+) Transcript_21975:80-979(+)|eukprot:CAMPEP_0172309108 /NCGR_PEP_ID=MMETSP1058-20130122/9494_1 /TAXON_ID=83371 /ORGANISM="Detonula confervacea, Strain CCMP 353" /LENGTH=299 /DNA_ID=CAMNT_0013021667 /DNA_START=80 /DNA_END=979 /DNA_ORIENTATION=+